MGLTAIAIGAVVAGGALGAASSVAAGISAKRAADISAEQAERDAELTIAATKFKARQERITGEEIISRGTAITGASGVKINRGSAKRVREVNQGRIETSISNIIFSGKVAAHRLRSQGVILRAQGKQARTAGFIRGATSILGAASSVAGISRSASLGNKLKAAPGFSDPSLGTATLRGEA